jgi:hypothetical protein
MDEYAQNAGKSLIETRSRDLFHASVDALDMRVRSRLARARNAALDAAASASGRPWFFQTKVWTPAVGISAAVLLAAGLWFGSPLGHHGIAASDQPALEDLDIVASSDEVSGDALEMLQNDLDFYDFADKAASSGPEA